MRRNLKRGLYPEKVLYFSKVKKTKDKKGELIIEGYANRTAKEGGRVVDRGKEHIPKESWKVQEWLANPIVFFNHDRDIPIGKGISAEARDEGLYVKIKISNSDAPEIKKARDLIEEGILQTFSVGIDVNDEEQDSDGVTILKDVNLLEVSVVSIPMNQESFFTISQKSLKTEPKELIASKILKAKGAGLAAALHKRIFELSSNEDLAFNRSDALEAILERSEMSSEDLMKILSGENVEVPKEALAAFAMVFNIPVESLVKLNQADIEFQAAAEVPEEDEPPAAEEQPSEEEAPAEDAPMQEEEEERGAQEEQEVPPADDDNDEEGKEETKAELRGETGVGTGEYQHTHEAQWDSSTGSGSTTSTKGEGPSHSHDIVDFAIKPGGEDDHTHSLTLEDRGDKSQKQENVQNEEFQKCVKRHIEEAIADGKSQDQAVAYAINKCRESMKCEVSYADWAEAFDYVDNLNKKQEIGNVTPADIDGNNEILGAIKQTNAFMGQVIGELQAIKERLNSMNIEKPQPVEEGPAPQTQQETTQTLELDSKERWQDKINKKLKDMGY